MQQTIQRSIITLILLAVISLADNAQTYVSGGIYSNTTWTYAGSPYIVTATVVLFPGFTLTIEPGVVIKFEDDQKLEIRQATLIAEGTPADSIIFTSNSASPVAGIWDRVYLNESNTSRISYCSFSYAYRGISAHITGADTLFLKASNLYNNKTGLFLYGTCMVDSCNIFGNQWGIETDWYGGVINYCNIFGNQYNGINLTGGKVRNSNISCNGQYGISGEQDSYSLVENCNIEYNQDIGIVSLGGLSAHNCIFRNNYTGFDLVNWHDTITKCLFQYNRTGVYGYSGIESVISNNLFQDDSIGLIIKNPGNIFSCNTFLNNINYAVSYMSAANSNCMINNYWSTNDSATIESLIYDGYDNVSYGLLSFVPFETASCPNTGPESFSYPEGCSAFLPINDVLGQENTIAIYPIPATDKITITTKRMFKEPITLRIFSLAGELVLQDHFVNKSSIEIDVSTLPSGVYIVKLQNKGGIEVKKLVIQ